MNVDPKLWRLALGVPFAGAGGLFGALTAPKGHRAEGAARGAGIGYMTGTGLGLGAQVGEMAAPAGASTGEMAPYSFLGGLGGSALGLGAGKLMQGTPEWEKKREFREELIALLREEHDKLQQQQRAQQTGEFQKTSAEEDPQIVSYVRENPTTATATLAGLLGAMTEQNKEKPFTSFLRGGVIGGGALGAGLASGAVARNLVPQAPIAPYVGGVTGGLLGYLALRKLLPQDENKRWNKRQEKQSAGPALKGLMETKRMSDQKDYRGKHSRLRGLIERYPDDFFIDSFSGNIAGLTHRPTGFKVHAPLHVLPVNLRSTISDPTQGGKADVAIPVTG